MPFWTYDWADEVLHAQIGRKWLKPDVGDVRTLLAMASEISARPSETLKARAKDTVQEDWWPHFVRDVLGRGSASLAGVDQPASPTFQALASE